MQTQSGRGPVRKRASISRACEVVVACLGSGLLVSAVVHHLHLRAAPVLSLAPRLLRARHRPYRRPLPHPLLVARSAGSRDAVSKAVRAPASAVVSSFSSCLVSSELPMSTTPPTRKHAFGEEGEAS